MKQINSKMLCYWCIGCSKLEDENFNGVMRCRYFIAGYEDWQEKWKEALKNAKQV